MREKRNTYRLLVGKPERKRPIGRLRCRWMVNIKKDLVEDWTGLVWLRIGTSGEVLSCECSNEPSGSMKCWETIESLHNLWLVK
jgi:hypothetical protein